MLVFPVMVLGTRFACVSYDGPDPLWWMDRSAVLLVITALGSRPFLSREESIQSSPYAPTE